RAAFLRSRVRHRHDRDAGRCDLARPANHRRRRSDRHRRHDAGRDRSGAGPGRRGRRRSVHHRARLSQWPPPHQRAADINGGLRQLSAPACRDRAMEISEPSSVLPASTRGCVLIVEDNPLNMKLFSAMVGSQGYDVLQAGDGRAALDLARRHHPNLIIMDLQLPDMSGLDVTRMLKADDDTRDIAIIATTAYALRGDEEKIRASGCDGYMAKPIA